MEEVPQFESSVVGPHSLEALGGVAVASMPGFGKAIRCDGASACVTVAKMITASGKVIGVRVGDSKHPGGPLLQFTPQEWEAFIEGVKDGEFDLPKSLKKRGLALAV